MWIPPHNRLSARCSWMLLVGLRRGRILLHQPGKTNPHQVQKPLRGIAPRQSHSSVRRLDHGTLRPLSGSCVNDPRLVDRPWKAVAAASGVSMKLPTRATSGRGVRSNRRSHGHSGKQPTAVRFINGSPGILYVTRLHRLHVGWENRFGHLRSYSWEQFSTLQGVFERATTGSNRAAWRAGKNDPTRQLPIPVKAAIRIQRHSR